MSMLLCHKTYAHKCFLNTLLQKLWECWEHPLQLHTPSSCLRLSTTTFYHPKSQTVFTSLCTMAMCPHFLLHSSKNTQVSFSMITSSITIWGMVIFVLISLLYVCTSWCHQPFFSCVQNIICYLFFQTRCLLPVYPTEACCWDTMLCSCEMYMFDLI